MLLTFLLLLGSAVVIYLSCETFVNGIEWVGRKFNVTQTATGTILAAFGTALPESVVTLVATAFGLSGGRRPAYADESTPGGDSRHHSRIRIVDMMLTCSAR